MWAFFDGLAGYQDRPLLTIAARVAARSGYKRVSPGYLRIVARSTVVGAILFRIGTQPLCMKISNP